MSNNEINMGLIQDINTICTELDHINDTGVDKNELILKVVSPLVYRVEEQIELEKKTIENIEAIATITQSYLENSYSRDDVNNNVKLDMAKTTVVSSSIRAIDNSESTMSKLVEIKKSLLNVTGEEEDAVVVVLETITELLNIMY